MVTSLSKDERMWGMLCHISAFAFFIFPFGNIIGPLVIWLIKRDVYQFVNEQGKESLNFQISVTIYALAALLLSIILIGIPILIALFFFNFIMVVVAAIKANDGYHYRYPLSIELIR